jgi:hypothetical protein
MAGAQVPSSVTILNSLKGFQGISLTEFATSALSEIAAGSVVEIAGAFFNFPADETINASTWTSIASGSTAYIVLVPAGTAGSQTVTAEFTATAPVWRDDNQGWYASAASVSRVIGSVYKVSATAQTRKNILGKIQSERETYNWRGEIERITSGSGNWTVPADVYRIRVTCVGGGGGGGAGGLGALDSAGGGGGGGGTNISMVIGSTINVAPMQSIAYSVGIGGAGGTSTASALNGADTTFDGAATGAGGLAGVSGSSFSGGSGGAGPSGGAGDYGERGRHGLTSRAGSGGKGGGAGGANTIDGEYGGGGGGGNASTTAAGAGGDGGSGIIIIEY